MSALKAASAELDRRSHLGHWSLKCACLYRGLAAKYHMPVELAYSMASLALYDIIIYADDSGSMAFEEGGERINDLKLMVGRVADVATMFDDDGILVRFMNGTLEGNGIRDSASAAQLISQASCSALVLAGYCACWTFINIMATLCLLIGCITARGCFVMSRSQSG